MSKPQIHHSIRLPQSQLQAVMDDLNRERGSGQGASRRETKRWRMQFQKIVVTLYTEMGEGTHYAAVPRNISTSGLAFLHGGYVHPGTRVAVALRAIDGTARNIPASIARCRHVRGGLHDLGVRFDEPLNPRDFFIFFGEDYMFQAEAVEPSRLAGRVLVVEDSRDDQRVIAHHFRETRIELMFADTADAGLAMLSETPDLAFVDHDLPDMDGMAFLMEADRRGFGMPMLLVSAFADRELRDAAVAAGAKEMLLKPFEPEHLHRAAAEYLLAGKRGIVADDAVVSEADPALVSREDVVGYVRELRRHANDMYGALSSGDEGALESAMKELTSTATLHGFPMVTSLAAKALKKLREGGVASARGGITRLMEACRRAQAPAVEAAETDAPDGRGAPESEAA